MLILFRIICLGDAQQNAENVTCEDQREALDSALDALGGLGKINSLLSVCYCAKAPSPIKLLFIPGTPQT